jgi:hypothetical protein
MRDPQVKMAATVLCLVLPFLLFEMFLKIFVVEERNISAVVELWFIDP